jgi:glycosyltransferase involved in cell wall biosynthesis
MTLSSLYAAASVFAFPSLVEGFGLPVLEALAHGTPVVTSAGTATAEVADGAARLVDPTDPSAIASGIEAALERDAVTLDLVERGRRRASELSWSAVARRYTAVFEEVVR